MIVTKIVMVAAMRMETVWTVISIIAADQMDFPVKFALKAFHVLIRHA